MDRGLTDEARNYAKQALEAADRQASGLRYHPFAGLVRDEAVGLRNRLQSIAA
jgi:hypothetical protein